MVQKKDYTQTLAELRRARRITLTTHVKPDGDAVGSLSALRRWLRAEGHTIEVIVPTPLLRRYAFLDPDGAIRVAGRNVDVGTVPPPDLLCIVDTGTWQQLEGVEALLAAAKRLLVIDHHPTQDALGDALAGPRPAFFRLVDPGAAATVVLVYRLLEEAGAAMDAPMATCLFAGLATDTDWFRLPTTGGPTLRLAATLVEAGAEPDQIYEHLFGGDDLAKVRLAGRAIETLHPALDGRVMVMWITPAMFRKSGADPSDTENLINECMRVRGTQVGVMLVDEGNGHIRVSLRSRPGTDILPVAEQFGGGGHRGAAGTRIAGTLDSVEAKVLDAIAQVLAGSAVRVGETADAEPAPAAPRPRRAREPPGG